MLSDERRAEIVRSMEQGPYMWTAEGEELLAEVDRLRAIVDKLDLTADGVCATPYMDLWHRSWRRDDGSLHPCRIAPDWDDGEIGVGETCSTPEAAEAAKEKQ